MPTSVQKRRERVVDLYAKGFSMRHIRGTFSPPLNQRSVTRWVEQARAAELAKVAALASKVTELRAELDRLTEIAEDVRDLEGLIAGVRWGLVTNGRLPDNALDDLASAIPDTFERQAS